MKLALPAKVAFTLAVATAAAGVHGEDIPSWAAEGAALRATLFAPGTVSTGDDDAHVTFSPDGRQVYFLKSTPDFRHWTIAVAEWTGRGWGAPSVAPFSGRWADGDLSFAPDGRTAYFVSNRPIRPGGEVRVDTDIWQLHRSDDGRWSEPEHLPELASDGFEWFPNMTADGWLYFGSERAQGNLGAAQTSDLWRARLVGEHFSPPENLGSALNTPGQDIEPWISYDGHLLIFASNGRPDTRGSYDLYVSHRCGETWTEPRNLGDDVNSPAWDFGPRLSPDGQYLFFTSNRSSTDRAPDRGLGFGELIERIRSPGNGLRDVYRIATAALELKSPCPPQSREAAGDH